MAQLIERGRTAAAIERGDWVRALERYTLGEKKVERQKSLGELVDGFLDLCSPG
jgi:hypothetical protein